MAWALVLLGGGLCEFWKGVAQSAPTFEVASVNVAPPNVMSMGANTGFGKVYYRNFPMTTLLTEAYNLKEYQISGPQWLSSHDLRYVVEARCPSDTPKDQVRLMLQALLVERFGLMAHREKRQLSVYALVVDANGSKLKKSTRETAGGFSEGQTEPGRVRGDWILKDFADAISSELERPVLDETGLDGMFEIDLTWTPNELFEVETKTQIKEGLSIFTAVRKQLGLKLIAKRAGIDRLVIDHLEKVPTPN